MAFNNRKPKLWKPYEDLILTELVEIYGERSWKKVAKNLENKHNIFRTSKQCRERWSNYLNQTSSLPLSKFEIKTILETQKKYGNKWSIIAKSLLGRSENQVKNFMHATVRRNIRKFNYKKPDSEKINISTLDALQNIELREILVADKQVKKSVLMHKKLSEEAKHFIRTLNSSSNNIKVSALQDRKDLNQKYFSDYESWDLKDFKDFEDIISSIDIFKHNNIDDHTYKLKFPCCFKSDYCIDEISLLERNQEISEFLNTEELDMMLEEI